ncbi:putative flap endonuclease-1-like 5' DNA nuclease [Methylopila capsulata]|uniref:Ferredoxin n=1 Tax=Methylopila capsulata TaxID=61654 RepID=A0A9W6ISW9_9HYPH|nr:DUF4332 domain-containing protein [Methylopila capsulata]MBM7850643.1 putative flap endonuclease-1-like 5' DNA nuclease [Methylopila capsulata]GLK55936.1 ferredoxin [Methylopila capsulata]
MPYPILQIEGVGPESAERLKKAGVRTSATLLDRAKDPKGRKTLAAATGIPASLILSFANRADLMRLRGVGGEYADLLAAVGVDTVKDLRNRNLGNLSKAIRHANAQRSLVRLAPSEKVVAKWIEQAKALPPVMTY